MSNLGWGTGRGETQTKNTYLGQSGTTNPLVDMMNRLAAQANQQTAERNLLFGGAGYGGSFQTPDQAALREQTGSSGSQKPYGGWYGYGNPGMGYAGSATYGNPTGGPTPGNGSGLPVPPRTTPPVTSQVATSDGQPTGGPSGGSPSDYYASATNTASAPSVTKYAPKNPNAQMASAPSNGGQLQSAPQGGPSGGLGNAPADKYYGPQNKLYQANSGSYLGNKQALYNEKDPFQAMSKAEQLTFGNPQMDGYTLMRKKVLGDKIQAPDASGKQPTDADWTKAFSGNNDFAWVKNAYADPTYWK